MDFLNRQWLLRERPPGALTEEHFQLVETPISGSDLSSGQFLVKILTLGFDPAMRGWVKDRRSYLPPVKLGEPMRGSGVGQVIKSNHSEFAVGTLVQGLTNWQEYLLADQSTNLSPVPNGVTPELALGVLGTTGLTAYFGLLDIGEPLEGDVVLISGAAGATGSVAAQIAKIKGCRVVGIAGGKEKCDWLVSECRADVAIDYKSESLTEALSTHCPNGVNVFFDNVGGDTLEAGISHMSENGRIVMCGGISGYNDPEPKPGPSNLMTLIIRRIKMQGFIVLDYLDQAPQAISQISAWLESGAIVSRVDMQRGFENVPSTLERLFDGRNLGKQLLTVAEPELPIP